jgi:hypothetical protein
LLAPRNDGIVFVSKANGMGTLEIEVGDIRPVLVAFTADELVVTLADGRRIATPLSWHPRLRDASEVARGRFELMPIGICWPDLDEDLGIAGMLRGRTSRLTPAKEINQDCHRPA